jgi:uncharacterized protein YqgC (DUF456 family)
LASHSPKPAASAAGAPDCSSFSWLLPLFLFVICWLCLVWPARPGAVFCFTQCAIWQDDTFQKPAPWPGDCSFLLSSFLISFKSCLHSAWTFWTSALVFGALRFLANRSFLGSVTCALGCTFAVTSLLLVASFLPPSLPTLWFFLESALGPFPFSSWAACSALAVWLV